MDKKNCVLLVLDKKFLESSVQKLNFEVVDLAAIFMDGGAKTFQVGEKKFPVISFANLYQQVKNYKNFLWLVDGTEDFRRVKNFLMTLDISEKNIINLEVTKKISPTWLANFHHVKENGADFFATGNEIMRDNLNLKFIPHENGVNLADINQNLQQSYLTAKNIFETVGRGKIKFVLIGLSPDLFFTEESEEIFDFNYLPILSRNNGQVDLNFDGTRKNLAFSAKAILDWEEKNFPENANEKNIAILHEYIRLCRANGAEPVGVIFPVAPAMKKTFDQDTLKKFLQIIYNFANSENFICVDLFNVNFDYDCFSSMTKLNSKGQMLANARLAMILYKMNLVAAGGFCKMNYEYFRKMSFFLPKDEYHALMDKIFKVSIQKICLKDKIKVGFVVRGAAEWCGDDLYNLFASNERFEPSIFLCPQKKDWNENEVVKKDFLNGVEQFKKRNLNVFDMSNPKISVPKQDVIIYLTPYSVTVPRTIRAADQTAETLMVHIPYAYGVSEFNNANYLIFRTAWKVFFQSNISLERYQKNSSIGMPRGVFSGYPRMDIFYSRNANFHFDWKMAQLNAKKIIYAPHWSMIPDGYATFQWNYKFMYEFAKNHPETSWVLKPHPLLMSMAIDRKVFPSIQACEEYLQMWDDLPNAQVYTGAYYQGLFATSDGMIHDSGSFIAEYQFVNKPMIYLTRAGEKFNELGQAVLNASYLVDGKNFDTIAETMQKVFIEGKDDKAPLRKDVYMKYLNYPGYTGMLASDFIYKSIADPLIKEA